MTCFLAVAQRAILVLAEACQLVQTHFLSWASKKENALQKKEDAKENLLEKVFSGLFRKTEGRGPSDSPGLLGRYSAEVYQSA